MAPEGESARVGRVSLLVQSQFTKSAVRAVSYFKPHQASVSKQG